MLVSSSSIAKSFSQDCEFEDEKVTEGKEYEYRVLAVNEAGSSEPSVPCKPITAKPTKGNTCIPVPVIRDSLNDTCTCAHKFHLLK